MTRTRIVLSKLDVEDGDGATPAVAPPAPVPGAGAALDGHDVGSVDELVVPEPAASKGETVKAKRFTPTRRVALFCCVVLAAAVAVGVGVGVGVGLHQGGAGPVAAATHVFDLTRMNTSSAAPVADTGSATGAWLLRGGGSMPTSPQGLIFTGDGTYLLPSIAADMTVGAGPFTLTASYQATSVTSAPPPYALCNFGGVIVSISPPSPTTPRGVLTITNTAASSSACSASFYLTSPSPMFASWAPNTMQAVTFTPGQSTSGIFTPTLGGTPFEPITPPPLAGGPSPVCSPVVWHGMSPMLVGGGGFAASSASAFVGTVASVAFSMPTPPLAMASPACAAHEWLSMAVQACETNLTAGGPTYCSRTNAMVAVASYQAAASLAGLPCPPPSSTAAAAAPARCFRSDTSAGGLPSAADAGAAAQVAVSRASRDVLSSLFPSQVSDFDALHSRVLARVALSAGSLRAGEAAGAACAAAVVTLRANDNAFSYDLSLAPSDATAFMASMAPGYWQPATTDNSLLIPGFMMALGRNWPLVTPWVMTSGAQFLASGPPAMNSTAWHADYNLSYYVGAVDSTTRTADQTEQAHFWAAEGGGTSSPPGHWVMIACKLALEKSMGLLDTLEMAAMLTTTVADAVITAWTAKYTYAQWRPVTAIPAGGGFPGGTVDATWRPLLPTPNFPDYISGHSTLGAAAAAVLESWFGSSTPVTLYTTTPGMAGSMRSWPSLDAAQNENAYSRVFGGVHWRSSCADAVAAGKALASFVLSANAWGY